MKEAIVMAANIATLILIVAVAAAGEQRYWNRKNAEKGNDSNP